MHVAYLGLGLMGAPMAMNLVHAGHDVSVWNRSPKRSEPLGAAGATVLTDPTGLRADVDVICTCLPDGSVVGDVLLGDAGTLEADGPVVVVDHSTIDPDHARELADRCAAIGAEFLDAPVSGGPHGAAAGTLAVFVGGEADALDRARPVVEAYAGRIVHLGGAGAGQVAKAANQMAIACAFVGIAEGFELAIREGVDPARLLEVLTAATADSAMLRSRVPVAGLQPRMPASNDWRPGFAADFMAKDLDFALEAADALDVPVTATRLVRELLERARGDGHGGDDWTILSDYMGAADQEPR